MKTPKQSKMYSITLGLLMFTVTLSAQWSAITNDNIWNTNTGNVGIGTGAPDTKLHIYKWTPGVANFLKLENIYSNTNANHGESILFKGYYKQAQISAFQNPQQNTGGDLQLQTYSDDNTLNTGIYLNKFGNVGIGLTNPTDKLTVNGNIKTNGLIYVSDGVTGYLGIGQNNIYSSQSFNFNYWNGTAAKSALSIQTGTGTIGIGTTSPIGKFDVKTETNQHIQMLSNTNGIYPGAAGIVSINDANSDYTPMGFLASNYFFANGNVGIGKLPTSIKLDVDGSASIDTEFLIRGSGEINGIGGEIHLYNSAKVQHGEMSRWSIFNMNKWYGNSLQFWAYDNFNTYNHRVTFADNGNVGIGVMIPDYKLDVAGNLHINSGVDDNHIYWGGHNMTMGTPPNEYAHNVFTLKPGGAAQGKLFSRLDMYSANSTSSFDKKVQISTEDYTYFNGGNVGIGTTSPDALLTVNGTIHAKEVNVQLSGPLADYVFDSNYSLMPLHQVESYVKENKHLPEVPSAAEVKDKGVNMGEMQNKLLQKIEELTLYVIEQQKQIEELKKQVGKTPNP